MRSFDCLGDPVRRRILGSRIDDGQAADEVGAVVQDEVGNSSSEVSRSTCGCCPTTGTRKSGHFLVTTEDGTSQQARISHH